MKYRPTGSLSPGEGAYIRLPSLLGLTLRILCAFVSLCSKKVIVSVNVSVIVSVIVIVRVNVIVNVIV